MTKEKFRTEIYEPWLKAYGAIKLLQNACKHLDDPEQDKENDKLWEEWMNEINRLGKELPDNPFSQALLSFLVGNENYRGVDEIIARMNQEELK